VIDRPAADDRTRARRELTLTVLLCALGALVELVAVGRSWASADHAAGSTGREFAGTSVAGAVKPLALVALAGAAALLATKRWGRVAVGVLLVAAGVGTIIAAAQAGGPHTAGVIFQRHPAWRIVTVIAALPVVAAGLAAAARGNRWSEMSARYEAPGTVRERAQDPDVALWEALDRGDDPTG
jgi:uncharacterized membrane protein (TIGR02234 family)